MRPELPLTNISSTNTTNLLDRLVRNHECIKRPAQSPFRGGSRTSSGDASKTVTDAIPIACRALQVVNYAVHREVIWREDQFLKSQGNRNNQACK